MKLEPPCSRCDKLYLGGDGIVRCRSGETSDMCADFSCFQEKVKPLTLTDRVLAFVTAHPGCTALAIAKNVGAHRDTVSSILNLKSGGGVLYREQGLTGSWTYYIADSAKPGRAGGPRGGKREGGQG